MRCLWKRKVAVSFGMQYFVVQFPNWWQGREKCFGGIRRLRIFRWSPRMMGKLCRLPRLVLWWMCGWDSLQLRWRLIKGSQSWYSFQSREVLKYVSADREGCPAQTRRNDFKYEQVGNSGYFLLLMRPEPRVIWAGHISHWYVDYLTKDEKNLGKVLEMEVAAMPDFSMFARNG